jgi:hypothetical protein
VKTQSPLQMAAKFGGGSGHSLNRPEPRHLRKQRSFAGKFAEQINSTLCDDPPKRAGATAGKIFSNVDRNVEVGENVSYLLKHQLPVFELNTIPVSFPPCAPAPRSQ